MVSIRVIVGLMDPREILGQPTLCIRNECRQGRAGVDVGNDLSTTLQPCDVIRDPQQVAKLRQNINVVALQKREPVITQLAQRSLRRRSPASNLGGSRYIG